MITGLLILVVCQLLGEVVVTALGLPIPGAVLGMAILFVALQLRRPDENSSVTRAGDAVLNHLQLLFIPAGVGVVPHLPALADAGIPVLAGLVLPWLVVIVVTAGAGVGARRLQSRLASEANEQGNS